MHCLWASAMINFWTELPDSKLEWNLSEKLSEIWDHSSVKLKTPDTPSLQCKETHFQTMVTEQNKTHWEKYTYMTKKFNEIVKMVAALKCKILLNSDWCYSLSFQLEKLRKPTFPNII